MKKTYVKLVGILSVLGLFTMTSVSNVLAADSTENTTATLKVTGGILEFARALPNFDFGSVEVNGQNHILVEVSAPSIHINDYRGVESKWELLVSEMEIDGKLPFYSRNLDLSLTPQLNNDTGQTELIITGESKLVMTGGRHENEVLLSPQLSVPKKVTVGDYSTTLEWLLKPAE